MMRGQSQPLGWEDEKAMATLLVKALSQFTADERVGF